MEGLDHQSLGALKLSKVAHTVFQSKGPMAFSEICKGVHDLKNKNKKKTVGREAGKSFPYIETVKFNCEMTKKTKSLHLLRK